MAESETLGYRFEMFTVVLILINILSFILRSSLHCLEHRTSGIQAVGWGGPLAGAEREPP